MLIIPVFSADILTTTESEKDVFNVALETDTSASTVVTGSTNATFFHHNKLDNLLLKNVFSLWFLICLLYPRLWLRSIAGKSTCGGSVAFPLKPTRRAVTSMGSNDWVVGEDHMLGPSCQRYNWQMGKCGSIVFGSSPRRGKTLISNPAVFRKYPHVKKTSGDNLEEKS